ncbi:MAG TPA: M20/M25/M40 family metallo-hydrolase [Candidatus Acidoferrum sp.]|jgi:Zn-dependent M28 family amino/carboxypeptidase
MNSRRSVAFVLTAALILIAVRAGFAQPPPAPDGTYPYAGDDARILAEIQNNSEAMANLEYLSDSIGARLSGTPGLKRANEWTKQKFTEYGLTNVHLEPWTVERPWTRGKASARITAPAEHPLTIASAAWSPGTAGAVHGPVVYFDAKEKKDFEKFRGKLKGAIVIYQEPASLSPQQPVDPYRAFKRPMQKPPARIGELPEGDPYEALLQAEKDTYTFWKTEGVAAVLRDSNKPEGLLNMTDISLSRYAEGLVPTAFITGEGYRMIWRLIKHGPVTVEIEMSNTFGTKPVEVYNTVADLRGSEKPDEMVIIGGHLDSWDLATGSTDNGTGSMAVLEAARALAKLKLKPKRTIRFVLFAGEEQGLYGSQEYVKTHQNELEKISAALVHDTGTGRVYAIGMHDNYQDRELVDQVLTPLPELKLLEPSMARSYGTDHLSFDEVGIPGFFCMQDPAEYRFTHHSQTDTFDKVWKDDLNQGAQVLATFAYNTAQLPGLLPRRPLPYNPAPKPAAAGSAATSAPAPDPVAEMDKKIIEQVKKDQPALKADLTYLADRIGPRLTGSPQLDRASHWTEEQFKTAGFANAHLESWQIANSWTREPASGRIVSPAEQNLTLASGGWSPGTNGTVRGNLIGVSFHTAADLDQYHGKLKGAIVLMGAPREMELLENWITTPWDVEASPLVHPKNDRTYSSDEGRKIREAMTKLIEEEKPLAVLYGSEKEFGLMNMSSALSRQYAPAAAPTAYVARESYLQMWRLMEQGAVEVELNLGGKLSGKPADVYNTVAEIRGSEKPDEVVIIAGHLDSWDLGTGATDNGAGAMAVLAAARALQKLGVQPKRTIRFVMFTGEEQGLNGSRAYVKAHAAELPKISALLLQDIGTGKVLTVDMMGNYAARETMDHVLYPLAAEPTIGLSEPTLRTEGGSDHVPFDEAGVPAFFCVQERADYDKMHHSQADTLDHVRWDDLTEGAQVMAVFAYNVAQLPDLLPRKPAKPAPAQSK